MNYKVILSNWRIGDYCLKKDDIVGAEYVGSGRYSISNIYFNKPILVNYEDLVIHCVEIKD